MARYVTVSMVSLIMFAVRDLDATHFQKAFKTVQIVHNETLISVVCIIVHVHMGHRTDCRHCSHAADTSLIALS